MSRIVIKGLFKEKQSPLLFHFSDLFIPNNGLLMKNTSLKWDCYSLLFGVISVLSIIFGSYRWNVRASKSKSTSLWHFSIFLSKNWSSHSRWPFVDFLFLKCVAYPLICMWISCFGPIVVPSFCIRFYIDFHTSCLANVKEFCCSMHSNELAVSCREILLYSQECRTSVKEFRARGIALWPTKLHLFFDILTVRMKKCIPASIMFVINDVCDILRYSGCFIVGNSVILHFNDFHSFLVDDVKLQYSFQNSLYIFFHRLWHLFSQILDIGLEKGNRSSMNCCLLRYSWEHPRWDLCTKTRTSMYSYWFHYLNYIGKRYLNCQLPPELDLICRGKGNRKNTIMFKKKRVRE